MGSIKLGLATFTKLKKIQTEGGEVLKGINFIKKPEINCGELYFSFVEYDKVKAWKLHEKATCRIIVPVGEVEFKFLNSKLEIIGKINIGNKNYGRLEIQPGQWFGFRGLSKEKNVLMNLLDIEHDPTETKVISKEEVKWN